MCIIAIAWQLFDDLPLVTLSNRDEFLDRPTTPAHQWADKPIFAGRDDKSGGTWLGIQQTTESTDHVSQNGYGDNRWGAVLNFREGIPANPDQRSRGELVTNFLTSDLSPMDYAKQIKLEDYAGFNLIVGNDRQAVVVNNRGYPPTALHSGLHVISNGQPTDDWFKTERLRRRMSQEVLPLIQSANGRREAWLASSWNVLSDTTPASLDYLPDTGVAQNLEYLLSSICIDTPDLPNYGTRTQSILTMERLGNEKGMSLDLFSRDYER